MTMASNIQRSGEERSEAARSEVTALYEQLLLCDEQSESQISCLLGSIFQKSARRFAPLRCEYRYPVLTAQTPPFSLARLSGTST